MSFLHKKRDHLFTRNLTLCTTRKEVKNRTLLDSVSGMVKGYKKMEFLGLNQIDEYNYGRGGEDVANQLRAFGSIV